MSKCNCTRPDGFTSSSLMTIAPLFKGQLFIFISFEKSKERIAKTLTLTILLAVLECALLSVFFIICRHYTAANKRG